MVVLVYLFLLRLGMFLYINCRSFLFLFLWHLFAYLKKILDFLSFLIQWQEHFPKCCLFRYEFFGDWRSHQLSQWDVC